MSPFLKCFVCELQRVYRLFNEAVEKIEFDNLNSKRELAKIMRARAMIEKVIAELIVEAVT